MYGINKSDQEDKQQSRENIDKSVNRIPLYCQVKYTDLKGEVSYLLNPACSNNKWR